MKNHRMWWLFFGGVLAFLFLGGKWNRNVDGLRAMEICEGVGKPSAPEWAFFVAGSAYCLGNVKAQKTAYQVAIFEPEPRLDIARSALPYDVEMAQAAVQAHPEQAQAYFWLGEAITEYFRIIDTGSIPVEPLSVTKVDAIHAYEEGVLLDPKNGEEWDNLGRLYEAEGLWENAVEAYNQACFYVDHGKNGCVNAGRVYLDHQMYEQALSRYLDSINQLPTYSPSLWGAAKVYIALERTGEAIPYLQVLAEQGDVEAKQLLSQIIPSP
ncbi:MAG TPA: tetratricopeptide repeat protein [Anaerolineales bacterium]|nr:tetratricopeptide repeat protein [Anaerolineales bacterium]